jgi:hypothetical protein
MIGQVLKGTYKLYDKVGENWNLPSTCLVSPC